MTNVASGNDPRSEPRGLARELGYGRRDWPVIDYQLYRCPKTDLILRGPEPTELVDNQYFVCIGAAQTFGCFCEQPFPRLLESHFEIPGLNLGFGGVGPCFFLKHEALLEYVNAARFVIVQVMSGRSESNSVFDAGGHEFLRIKSTNQSIGADRAYTQLLRQHARITLRLFSRHELHLGLRNKAKLKALITETRRNWIENYRTLLDRIEVPKILLYISKRSPEYSEFYCNVHLLMGQFPQLVNRSMIEEVAVSCDHYVECATRRGSPQPLVSRFTGEPVQVYLSHDRTDFDAVWRKNAYYPSPEMHEDAAALMAPVCNQYVASQNRNGIVGCGENGFKNAV